MISGTCFDFGIHSSSSPSLLYQFHSVRLTTANDDFRSLPLCRRRRRARCCFEWDFL